MPKSYRCNAWRAHFFGPAIRLKYKQAQRNFYGSRIRRRLVDGDVNSGSAGRERLMKENSAVHGANEHRALADRRIIDLVVPLRVRLRVAHDGHAALQLDEQHIHARGRLVAVCAVVNDAGNRPRLRRGGCEQKQNGQRKEAQSQ